MHELAGESASPQIPVGRPGSAVNQHESKSRLEKLERLLGLDGRLKAPSRRATLLMAIACAVAFAASGYLGWVALTSSKIAGCGGGRLFNCGHVISSRWSLWLGIPVSMIAASTYAWMAAGMATAKLYPHGRIAKWAWYGITTAALSAGMAAIWFVSLQVFVLNHLCTYCLVAHACGLAVAATVLLTRPLGWKALATASLFSLFGFVALAGVQLVSEDPATYKIETYSAPAEGGATEFEAPVFEAPVGTVSTLLQNPILFQQSNFVAMFRPSALLTGVLQQPQQSQSNSKKSTSKPADTKPVEKPRRFVTLNGGTAKLDVAQWPIVGSIEAKYIFVEMFDYSCPHCRNTHAAIKAASAKLDNSVAVIALPIPLNATCNTSIQVTDPKFAESCEIAKLAVAVWRVDRAQFTEFHNWMMSTDAAPTLAEARTQAESLVDVKKLQAELATDVPGQYVAQNTELYRRVGAGNVPKLIFPTTSIVGEFTSGDALADIVKQQIK